MLAGAPAKLHAFQSRHKPIQDDQHGTVRLLQNLPCLSPIGGDHHLISPTRQRSFEQAAGDGFIFGNEYFHAASWVIICESSGKRASNSDSSWAKRLLTKPTSRFRIAASSSRVSSRACAAPKFPTAPLSVWARRVI